MLIKVVRSGKRCMQIKTGEDFLDTAEYNMKKEDRKRRQMPNQSCDDVYVMMFVIADICGMSSFGASTFTISKINLILY